MPQAPPRPLRKERGAGERRPSPWPLALLLELRQPGVTVSTGLAPREGQPSSRAQQGGAISQTMEENMEENCIWTFLVQCSNSSP